MRILAIGDIVGDAGMQILRNKLPNIVKNEAADFIIINAENAADGMGITENIFKELLALGANVITMGNHTWGKRDIFKFIEHKQLVRPANYPEGVPGKGYVVSQCNDKKIAVVNLIGRTEMNVLSENPFLKAEEILEKLKGTVDIIIVDFHAEATAEKKAMSYFIDGKATILFGTHTHIQTADETIMEHGLAYITDIGMTGPKESVIGMDIETSIKRFCTSLPERYKSATGEGMVNGCIFEIDDNTNKVLSIRRIVE